MYPDDDYTNESETAMERRLEEEATTRRLGTLGNAETCTDSAKVQVTYHDDRGTLRAGYFVAHVTCDELADDADEDLQMANHPASRAEELVELELERRAEELADASVYDVSAY